MWEKKKLEVESQYNAIDIQYNCSGNIGRGRRRKKGRKGSRGERGDGGIDGSDGGRRSTVDGRQWQIYSVVNEQSFEPNMRCPARMLGTHIQAVKVRRTCVHVASRYARRVNRDKLSNWHRPSGTLPSCLREPANSPNMLLSAPFCSQDRLRWCLGSRPRNFPPLYAN